jgi:hypothetical protein
MPTGGRVMVDNIKLNKILPSLSSAAKVQRPDQRKDNHQQNSFEEVFKKKRRKKQKKDDSELASISAEGNAGDDEPSEQYDPMKDADKEEKSADSPSSRIIDIRV